MSRGLFRCGEWSYRSPDSSGIPLRLDFTPSLPCNHDWKTRPGRPYKGGALDEIGSKHRVSGLGILSTVMQHPTQRVRGSRVALCGHRDSGCQGPR